jgi:hypothetical protein
MTFSMMSFRMLLPFVGCSLLLQTSKSLIEPFWFKQEPIEGASTAVGGGRTISTATMQPYHIITVFASGHIQFGDHGSAFNAMVRSPNGGLSLTL